jgi:hypothetical protein
VRATRGVLIAGLASVLAYADEPPKVDHQPIPCTLRDKPFTLCARISDDSAVVRARVLFRKAGEKYYSAIDMAFGGLSYCATLPAPRAKVVEYYVQAFDDKAQPERTGTHQLRIVPEGQCDFPPVEQDPERTRSFTVFATAKEQGKDAPSGFAKEGVVVIPLRRR